MTTGTISSQPDSENIYRTLVEEHPLPIALYTGPEMRVSQVNKALLKVWGKGDNVIGKTFREALPELEGQPFYQLLDDVYRTGIAYQASEDKVDLFIDGRMQTFYFNITYKPLKNEKGQVWGILNIATDVTELVLTKAKLAEAESNTSFALNAARLGTWNLDTLNNIVTWDERCKELYGFEKDRVLSFEDVIGAIHPHDQERVREEVAKALDPQYQGNYDIQFRTADINNRPRFLRNKGKAFFNEDNIAYRFAGTVQDITDDVLAQKEQQKLLTLIENSVDLIGVTDLNGMVTYLNKAGRELIGAENAKEYMRPSTDFFDPEDFAKQQPAIAEGFASRGRWSGEICYRHLKTGETIPCHINAFTINDPQTGEVIGMASVTRDLRLEKERQKEQKKLLTLVENSADLMSILEPNGINSYINKAGKELLGFENDEEVLKTPISELHTPEDIAFVEREVLPAVTQRGTWSGRMNVRNIKTGEVIPVYNSTIRIDDPLTGELVGIGALMRDIRPELAAQQALADSEKLFRDITTAAPAALWTANENMSITYVNRIWIDWTQQPFSAHLGNGWLDMVLPEDRDKAAAQFETDFTARRTHESQFRIKNQDGRIRWVICTGNPQYRSSGLFTGYIGACVDITELKQLQRQKDDFLGIASHELKTPVTSIKAYAQVLESMFRDSGDLKKADMVKKMDAQVNRLTKLIGDLLDVTKIQAGKLQLNNSEFNFNDMVRELIEDLQRTTRKHTIVEQLADTGLIYADRERISQVVTNLITNAIKYSPNSDKIMVYTKRENDEVRLCVQDFGIGIPNDKKDKVFEQFYRVSGTKQHTFPGLGLGLYISSEIIKREGGKIWVNSTEGQGSTFCFSIPAAQNQCEKE